MSKESGCRIGGGWKGMPQSVCVPKNKIRGGKESMITQVNKVKREKGTWNALLGNAKKQRCSAKAQRHGRNKEDEREWKTRI